MTEDFIQNIQFDLFSVELVIGETATLLMAEDYVTIREVFVDNVKEKEHNKAFYDMCCYVMPNYHQVEFDLRVYLLYIDKFGKLY